MRIQELGKQGEAPDPGLRQALYTSISNIFIIGKGWMVMSTIRGIRALVSSGMGIKRKHHPIANQTFGTWFIINALQQLHTTSAKLRTS